MRDEVAENQSQTKMLEFQEECPDMACPGRQTEPYYTKPENNQQVITVLVIITLINMNNYSYHVLSNYYVLG